MGEQMKFARIDNIILNIDEVRCFILQPARTTIVLCYRDGKSYDITYFNLEAAKETYEYLAKALTELK
jgi:hypothetical protein